MAAQFRLDDGSLERSSRSSGSVVSSYLQVDLHLNLDGFKDFETSERRAGSAWARFQESQGHRLSDRGAAKGPPPSPRRKR